MDLTGQEGASSTYTLQKYLERGKFWTICCQQSELKLLISINPLMELKIVQTKLFALLKVTFTYVDGCTLKVAGWLIVNIETI